MIYPQKTAFAHAQWALVATILVAITGCGAARPKPAELPPNVALLKVQQVWAAQIGAVKFPLVLRAAQGSVAAAASDGSVVLLDAQSGREQWRASAGAPLAAGVGGSGTRWSVVTRGNELVTFDNANLSWRAPQPTPTYTPPLVAGGRVFVLTADRSTAAFDGASGRRLWLQQRPSEPLALRQAGLLTAVGNTLVAGLSGRMVGMNPDTGDARWEVALASPRGTNDVERLVDLVEPASRDGDVLCARAFQAAVGCVDARRGVLLWSKPANGFQGLGGDAQRIFGTEGDGTVRAWRRSDGEPGWSTARYKYRRLTAPLAVGRALVFGDNSGVVHFVAREDGAPLNRVPTDGSAVVAGPTQVGDNVVVVTERGGVFALRTE